MSTVLSVHETGRGPSVSRSLLDEFMPRFDATRIERRTITADPVAVYDAVLRVDFLDAARHHPAVQSLFLLRNAFERTVSLLLARRRQVIPDPPALRLADMPVRGEWAMLRNDSPREVVFGAIGRFWAGETVWRSSSAADFADFAEPGHARIGCSLRIIPNRKGGCELIYEARTQATDPNARRGFLRYWRVVSPFVGVVMRSLLTEVERTVATI